ncbi:class I SAM-dependent methyltransferase [Thiomicrorhabdus sp. 6S3-12]|nr:class I SAM-dependent methyltransferase [Thiomicrorhabdus sp. 6S3-12]
MWDKRYSSEEYQYGTEANDFLKQSVHHLPQTGTGKILCLGEGEGRNAVFLAEQGFDVTAVDASEIGLQKALALAESRGVRISTQVADLANYDLGTNRWDGIISIFCHLPEALRLNLHQKVALALKPQGVFILEAYRPEQLLFATGGPPQVELMMTLEGLKNELADLEHRHLCELEREVNEGVLHNGMAAVVQLIATKED